MDRVALVAETLAAEHGVRSEILSPAQLAAAEPGLTETGAGAIHWLDPWTVSDPGGLRVGLRRTVQPRRRDLRQRRCGDARAQRLAAAGRFDTVDGRDRRRGRRRVARSMVSRSPAKIRLSLSDAAQAWLPSAFQRRRHAQYAAARSRVCIRPGADGEGIAHYVGRRTDGTVEGRRSRASSNGPSRRRADWSISAAQVEAEPWSGVRPCMPDMLPVIGSAPKHKGLWMHFGHGHHGHTLGPTTGRLLAELMSGEQTFTDASAFRPAPILIASQKRKGRIIDPALRLSLSRESLRRRLHQAFLGQRFLHLRACADAGLVGHQVRESGEIEFHPLGP